MSIIIRIEKVIEYIEEHIYEPIELNELCKIIYMSKSSFYTVFKSLTGTTIKDYIRKRRLSLSSYDLIYTNDSILDIAIKYQYQTSESFSRAFKKHFNMSPSEYRLTADYLEYFPMISMSISEMLPKMKGGVYMKQYLDKNKLIDQIDTQKGYILDIDLDKFDKVNENYGFSIGDQVLVEAANRIKEQIKIRKLDIPVTRIGGDEFVVILNDMVQLDAINLAEGILDAFNSPMVFDKATVKVTASIGMSEFHRNVHAKEAMDFAFSAVLDAKKNGRHRLEIHENNPD